MIAEEPEPCLEGGFEDDDGPGAAELEDDEVEATIAVGGANRV